MKHISTNGITVLEPLEGAEHIYFGTDTLSGDLYEAEELFRKGKTVTPNRLVFVTYPEGAVTEPVKAASGQYLGDPLYYDGEVYVLLVDFKAGEIRVLKLDSALENARLHAMIPLSRVEDCYNLKLDSAPLMLTRAGDGAFETVWPEKHVYDVGERETFLFRDGDELYFLEWNEEGMGKRYRYWEETLVRDLDGRVTRRMSGEVQRMPNGEKWLIG